MYTKNDNAMKFCMKLILVCKLRCVKSCDNTLAKDNFYKYLPTQMYLYLGISCNKTGKQGNMIRPNRNVLKIIDI